MSDLSAMLNPKREETDMYYDREGIPTGIDGLVAAFASNRRVGFTRITGGRPPCVVEVSTVYLGGINHSDGFGPPKLFETMVFDLPDDDEICERYTTEQQAREGHKAVVVQVAASMSDPVVLDLDPDDATTVVTDERHDGSGPATI